MKKGKQTHILKIQDVGDRYKKQVRLKVRLEGKWLCDAGFNAEERVIVSNPEKGKLVVRVLDDPPVS